MVHALRKPHFCPNRTLTLHVGQFFMLALSSADFFFKINIFEKIISGLRMSIQIRPDFLLRLIWVQTVYKGYQQMNKVAPRVLKARL